MKSSAVAIKAYFVNMCLKCIVFAGLWVIIDLIVIFLKHIIDIYYIFTWNILAYNLNLNKHDYITAH